MKLVLEQSPPNVLPSCDTRALSRSCTFTCAPCVIRACAMWRVPVTAVHTNGPALDQPVMTEPSPETSDAAPVVAPTGSGSARAAPAAGRQNGTVSEQPGL